jgi:hypothetical protein
MGKGKKGRDLGGVLFFYCLDGVYGIVMLFYPCYCFFIRGREGGREGGGGQAVPNRLVIRTKVL